jgi:PhzF family phenazine biosynthesis protein
MMDKIYRIYQVDSFTKVKLTGNPAGVVLNADGLTDAAMQSIARELNNSETAFVMSPTDNTHDVRVRFFTPTREVPICGHATVAAHYVRAVENRMSATRVLQKTGAGILPVDIVPEDGDYKIVMTQGRIEVRDALPEAEKDALFTALGVSPDDLTANFPVAIASTGHSKVMVGIRDIGLLNRLRPDMGGLVALSERIGCNGYYVFTLRPDESPMVHGRMFAPAVGIPEDPVTGNANGPLGAYLVRYGLVPHDGKLLAFDIVQGEAIGRAGTMRVEVAIQNGHPVDVKIAGHAVIAFSTELTL